MIDQVLYAFHGLPVLENGDKLRLRVCGVVTLKNKHIKATHRHKELPTFCLLLNSLKKATCMAQIQVQANTKLC